MAKILFSSFSRVEGGEFELNGPFFYQLVDSLVAEGNEVYLMNTNGFNNNSAWTNNIRSDIDTKKLDQYLAKIDPDIVFAFNNSLYEHIPKILNCPIAVWACDSPEYFADKRAIEKNPNRYNVLHFAELTVDVACRLFKSSKSKNHVIGYASGLQPEEIEKKNNICFIGTNFNQIPNIKKFFLKNFYDKDLIDRFNQLLRFFIADPLSDPKSYLKRCGLDDDFFKKHAIGHIEILTLLSSSSRIKTLSAISDLGLIIFGSPNWYDCAAFDINFLKSISSEKVYTAKQNQDVYNSSKISISISHAQSGATSIPWRICDIMATNSVLVSDYKPVLDEMFGKYVKIPTYENSFEAREVCQRLLKDDHWRRDIIAASQIAINDKYRFKHRLKDISEIFGIDLLPMDKSGGKVHYISKADFQIPKLARLMPKHLFGKNGPIRDLNRKIKRKIRSEKKD